MGDANLKQFQYILDFINAKGGALGKKFELVPFDNKSQPSDALIALKSATDQTCRSSCRPGSNIAAALIEGVEKHNERNPESRIVYINCGAVATRTHATRSARSGTIRFDAHVAMKTEIMARAMPKDVTKVYLLNQDYPFGHPCSATSRTFLASSGPTFRSWARAASPWEDQGLLALHHQGQGAGAQAAHYRQLGPRHELLIKAGIDAGIDLRYYTLYAHLVGRPDRDRPGRRQPRASVMSFNENIAPKSATRTPRPGTRRSATSTPFDFYARPGFAPFSSSCRKRITKAGAVDPMKIAYAMEGLKHKDFLGYDAVMRKDDHQLVRPTRGRLQEGGQVRSRRPGSAGTEVTSPPRTSSSPTAAR